jgi:SPP1 family predicted phage head-tail adaptor
MARNEVGIRAGSLRQRVEIVQPGTSTDSFGGTTPGGGASLGTVWASIEALTGRDALAAQSFTSIGTRVIKIRWMAGVLAKQQVKFGTRTFQIEAVLNPDERTKVLKLLCVEVNDSSQQN